MRTGDISKQDLRRIENAVLWAICKPLLTHGIAFVAGAAIGIWRYRVLCERLGL